MMKKLTAEYTHTTEHTDQTLLPVTCCRSFGQLTSTYTTNYKLTSTYTTNYELTSTYTTNYGTHQDHLQPHAYLLASHCHKYNHLLVLVRLLH